jgi:putative aminopeptidase FrvX
MQHAVGSYGNDTVSFFMENCPTAILASPLKYMHTTVEMVHKQDVENAISAFVLSILELNPTKIAAINDQTSKYI